MRLAFDLPPPPTPPRHASHGGRGAERPARVQTRTNVNLAIETADVPSVSPPHTSEASGGGGVGGGGNLTQTPHSRKRDSRVPRARAMRHEPTDAERVLWLHLRHLIVNGSHFRRQATIGPYLADFACHRSRLVIELDGGQHNEAAGLARDAKRTDDLCAGGYRVLRFWNNDVLSNVEGVMQVIAAAVRHSPPPPTPPRHASHGGRGAERPGRASSKRKAGATSAAPDLGSAVPRVSPPHTSEASGGEGSGVGGKSR